MIGLGCKGKKMAFSISRPQTLRQYSRISWRERSGFCVSGGMLGTVFAVLDSGRRLESKAFIGQVS